MDVTYIGQVYQAGFVMFWPFHSFLFLLALLHDIKRWFDIETLFFFKKCMWISTKLQIRPHLEEKKVAERRSASMAKK